MTFQKITNKTDRHEKKWISIDNHEFQSIRVPLLN